MFSIDPFADLSGLLDQEDDELKEDGQPTVSLGGLLKLTMITNMVKLMAAPDGQIFANTGLSSFLSLLQGFRVAPKRRGSRGRNEVLIDFPLYSLDSLWKKDCKK